MLKCTLEDTFMPYVLFYLICVNIVSFVLFGLDKSRAVRRQWRISEKTLLLTALIGGSLGAEAGMLCFRHKTKHARFRIGIPAVIIVQLLIGIGLSLSDISF